MTYFCGIVFSVLQNPIYNNVGNFADSDCLLPFRETKNARIALDQDAGHAVPPEFRLCLDRRTHRRLRMTLVKTREYAHTESHALLREETASEKRLRDHFHERCGNLAPADCSLNARFSCTPSHRRDRGYEYIDSITQTTRVCQGGTRKKCGATAFPLLHRKSGQTSHSAKVKKSQKAF